MDNILHIQLGIMALRWSVISWLVCGISKTTLKYSWQKKVRPFWAFVILKAGFLPVNIYSKIDANDLQECGISIRYAILLVFLMLLSKFRLNCARSRFRNWWLFQQMARHRLFSVYSVHLSNRLCQKNRYRREPEKKRLLFPLHGLCVNECPNKIKMQAQSEERHTM